MILRVTGQLAKQIGIAVKDSLPQDENPYRDWTCRLVSVADDMSYVLATNTASLYSVLIPWAESMDVESFRSALFRALGQHLTLNGFGAIYTAYIEPVETDAVMAKSLNRSVTGSMNDLVRLADYMLVEERCSFREASNKLNETPFGILGYDHPRERFAALATLLTSG